MRCSELESYLEATLEGRLGRVRTAAMRQHLATCRSCAARVTRLRRFEIELRRRFRAMGEEPSLWAPIEVDLVGRHENDGEGCRGHAPETGPGRGNVVDEVPGHRAAGGIPRRDGAKASGHRALTVPPAQRGTATGGATVRKTTRASTGRAGLDVGAGRTAVPPAARRRGGTSTPRAARIIVALSLIGVLAFAADRLRLFERPDGIAAVYAAYRSGARDPALATEDRRRLQLWLSAKLGIPLPRLPELRGYTLVGGEVLDGEAVGAEEGDLAVLAYAPAGDIHPPSDDAEAGTHAPAAVLLLLAPRDEQAWSIVNEELAGDGDLDHVGWNADRFGFLAVSDLPLDRADFALR